MSIEELILVPKGWTTSLNQISNFKVNYNVTNENKQPTKSVNLNIKLAGFLNSRNK